MPPPFETHGVIGARPPRIEGLGKVTGRALYGADHSVPGDALHAALVLAPIARGGGSRSSTTPAPRKPILTRPWAKSSCRRAI